MTQDEIIEMAIQAGMSEEIAAFNIPIIEAFAHLAAAKEREACAQYCDMNSQSPIDMAAILAEAIRARGENMRRPFCVRCKRRIITFNVRCPYCGNPQRQPLTQEPVADDFFRMIADRNPKPFSSLQRTWVGLTDEEMMDAIYVDDTPMERGRRVEAKLKDKNS